MIFLLPNLLVLLLLNAYGTHGEDVVEFFKREKCIDELGCFNAGSPFFDIVERPLSLLPDDRDAINTTFLLYTSMNPLKPETFTNFNGSWVNVVHSGYNPRAKTIFVVPGYISKTYSEWKQPLRESLMEAEESNIFFVDWTGGDGPLYEQAVANSRVVGAEIALFIKHLQDSLGLKPETVHIIGHSLGSHIAGYAGKNLKNLGRITAMDPAGPYFTSVDPAVRLDRKDALLVDAIHTNAAASRFQGFGLTESIAHFDFYPNGGHLQPGCLDMGQAILSLLGHLVHFDPQALHDIECNHIRAISLFTSSIHNVGCALQGVVCESWEDFNSGKCGSCTAGSTGTCLPLGMHVDKYSNMIQSDRSINVYLNTTGTDPYCS